MVLPLLFILALLPNAYAVQFDYSNSTTTHDYNSMTLDEFFGPHNLHVWDSFAILISDSNEHAIKVINTTNLIDPNGGPITYSYNDRIFHLTAADVPTMSFPYIGQYNVTDLNDGTKFGIFNVVDKSVDLSSLPLPVMPVIQQPIITNESNSTQSTPPVEQTPVPDNSTQTSPPPVEQTPPQDNTTVTTPPVEPPPTTTNPQPLMLPTIVASPSNLAKCDSLRAQLGLPPLETIMNVVIDYPK